MTAVNDRAFEADFLDALSTRVTVGDGVMRTRPRAADLGLDDVDGLGGAVETKYVRLQSG